MNWIIAFSAIILIAIIIFSAYKFAKYKKKKPKDKIQKTKKPKKVVKQKIKQDKLQLKGSYCDTVDKFLYRKEVKLLIVISKILPKEYVVFPKIGIDNRECLFFRVFFCHCCLLTLLMIRSEWFCRLLDYL